MLTVQVKKSKRAKQLRLKASIFGLYVVVPIFNYEIDEVMKFLNIKKEWILETSEYYERLRIECSEEDLKLNTISFLGKRYSLRVTKDIAASVIVSDNLQTITFHVTDRRRYKTNIKRWYLAETKKIISERIDFIRKRNPNLPACNRVLIKDQRSRWASCSKSGNLNFNLLLASLPVELIDYVIVHELAHLIELNHSKEFWNIVKLLDPEFQHHRKLLHKYWLLTDYVQ
ncbi:MAG TPA: SprT family zinc-dependent metalloprotease [Candidatus Nitrosopolaris sp.]|nr:SprT family zinc-dependent metalloprotease [Candidatus Nitrosopolaris sp.]